jgi:hypothetical protein
LLQVFGGTLVFDFQKLREDVLVEPVRDGGGFEGLADFGLVLGEDDVEGR